MTVTTATPVKSVNAAKSFATSRLVTGGLTAAAVAAVATSAVAGLGQFAGISLDVNGAPIPVTGFAVLTALFSVVGLALALVLARKAGDPRRAFVRTTVVLTALSFVPDLLAGAAVSTKAVLVLTHLVAAAIVIPAIARRLSTKDAANA